MQIGLGHFTCLHLPPADLVRLARQAGFGFVGMRFHPVAPGLPHWLPSPAGQADLARVMAGEGIALYDIETVVIDAGLDPDMLGPALDAAAALGGQRVNCCADLFPGLTERFAHLCALAAERGLGVDIEPMRWRGVNTPAACLSLIAASGAPNAGYLVDTLHHHRCGGTPEEIVAMSAGVVRSAQVCDAPAATPETTEGLIAEARGGRLLPGDGGLPLRETLRAVPDGTVISVELPNAQDRRDDLTRARAIYAATKTLLENL
ncbi:sugar phosphate isomerase/epimerase family protein [Antarctobacter sp.]|uniref:sugar phosphate isomerase/epimerase family protein n=1 Tax=Antarctobacter sp. TaxID=1872577 RepID=UPI003A9103F0